MKDCPNADAREVSDVAIIWSLAEFKGVAIVRGVCFKTANASVLLKRSVYNDSRILKPWQRFDVEK